MTYAEMAQIAEDFVAAVEDAIMENWPEERRTRPVPEPSYYSPYYDVYAEYLRDLSGTTDHVYCAIKLLQQFARMWA
jgi:hypothetical protein